MPLNDLSRVMLAPEKEFIAIGKVLAPLGNRGKMKIETTSDFPQRFAKNSTIYIMRKPMSIDNVSWQKGRAIVKLSHIDSIEDAERLRGQPVEIYISQVKPLPPGQYYHFQFIGLEVWTTQGELLGKITEILTNPSNDTYIISGAQGEILIPAIDDVVKSVDLDHGRLVIEPITGLLDLNRKAAS